MQVGQSWTLVLWLAVAGISHAQAAYEAPRTPEGHTDFQGVWSSAWLTPLERPPEATSLVLTEEEAHTLSEILWKRVDVEPLSPLESIDTRSLVLVGGQSRSSLIVDPADGRLPLTEEARRRRQPPPSPGLDGPEARPPSERCAVRTNMVAPMLVLPAGNMKQIVQTSDYLLILSETYTLARIIPLRDRAQAAPGYGRGRWEGETLVVETSGFAPNDRIRAGPSANFPISPASRITERFTRTSENEILYSFEVEDPSLYVKAWKAEMALAKSGQRVFEWACHEANYSMTNMLRGARLAEDRASKATQVEKK